MCDQLYNFILFISKSFLHMFLINWKLKLKDFNYVDINIYSVPGSFWIQTKLIEKGHIYQD